jgi:hypothetical protein
LFSASRSVKMPAIRPPSITTKCADMLLDHQTRRSTHRHVLAGRHQTASGQYLVDQSSWHVCLLFVVRGGPIVTKFREKHSLERELFRLDDNHDDQGKDDQEANQFDIDEHCLESLRAPVRTRC